MSNLVSKEVERLNKAISFACERHKDQIRKGTNVPYVFHLMEVSTILQGMNGDTDLIIAGLLHDTVEDTNTTFEELEKEFGSKVAEYVRSDTEDKSKTWEERKEHTVLSVESMDCDCKKLLLADKLSNLRSSYNDLKYSEDKNIWGKFKRGKEQQKKYYTDICNALRELRRNDETREYYIEFVTLLGKVFKD
jgi:(p)ppGpp synthase/HD superfamily hydrolase